MKKVFCHNLFVRIFNIFFVLFGFWTLYLNLCDKEKNSVFIIISVIFILFFVILSSYGFKKIQIDEISIIYRNLFFKKKIIKIQEIKDIIFCRSNAEKYVEIKYENQIVRIEYSNKKVEDEFKKILQKVLTNQHNEK